MWVPRPRAAPTARTAARAATRHHAPLLPAVAAGAQQRQAVDPTGTPGDAVHAGGDSTGGGTDGAGAFNAGGPDSGGPAQVAPITGAHCVWSRPGAQGMTRSRSRPPARGAVVGPRWLLN